MIRHTSPSPFLKLAVALGISFGVAAACESGSDDNGDDSSIDPTTACDTIMDVCHPKDDGTNDAVTECHGVAHDGNGDACVERYADCIETCNAAPDPTSGEGEAGTSSDDSGTDDHGDDHGSSTSGSESGSGEDSSSSTTGDDVSPECMDYCECMSTTCAGFAGYPWDSVDACQVACEGGIAGPDLECWTNFCEMAKAGTSPDHNCEHAWGQGTHC